MKRAFLAAVDAYRAPYTMKNNINDMNDTRTSLLQRGFQVVQCQSNPSKATIINGLRDLVNTSYAGDSICFGFFGHGGKVPSAEPDGTSECLCASDWESGGLVWDYEVDAILRGLRPGVNCDLFFGCCYGAGIHEVPGAQVISWSACGENELAWVVLIAGIQRGIWPWLLNLALRGHPAAPRDQVSYYAYYWTRYYIPSQNAEIRGTASELAQLPFS
jgi:hypothetical protein